MTASSACCSLGLQTEDVQQPSPRSPSLAARGARYFCHDAFSISQSRPRRRAAVAQLAQSFLDRSTSSGFPSIPDPSPIRYACAEPPISSLRARWERSNKPLVIMSGETVIGSLKKQTGGTIGDRWAWSITCVLPDPRRGPAQWTGHDPGRGATAVRGSVAGVAGENRVQGTVSPGAPPRLCERSPRYTTSEEAALAPH